MNPRINLIAAGILLAATSGAFAAVHYVDLNSANPTPPYTSWATAARVIQDAVDVAAAGDEVLVTNGIYATGGRVVYGSLTNRVAVTKPLFLHSVNGPDVTVIQGYQVPGVTNGDGAIRCVYLTEDASMSGFTVTKGATRDASGNSDYGTEQCGGGVWCEFRAAVSNCVVTGNSAYYMGGGAYQGDLNNCNLSGNSASKGGGAGGPNPAFYYNLNLNNCTVYGNSAHDGGGVYNGKLYNCTVSGNSAQNGGGVLGARMLHCTVTGNSAAYCGGYMAGYSQNSVDHCILYFNTAEVDANFNSKPTSIGGLADFDYCCTTPDPGGDGNIFSDPQLADSSHLTASSPCRGAGDAYSGLVDTDIDGQSWLSPPSIGCDEYYLGASGPLQVAVTVNYTNVATGFVVNLSASILGHANSNRWDFGDGAIVTSQVFEPLVSHVWTNAGGYVLTLSAYNETYPAGVSATVTIHVVNQPVHYVSLTSAHPLAPYTSWATAATNIQDAVDAAFVGGTVLVTNGIYACGGETVDGYTFNQLVVAKPLAVSSVNGPEFTVIDGGQSNRCVFLAAGATLSGFTLANGVADNGGGVCCVSASETISNCVIKGNTGGGAIQGTLNNCSVSANTGGGIIGGTANNCTLTGNSGLGAFGASLNNCIVYSNQFNYDDSCTLNYCCTTPLPPGTGNISADPHLTDSAHLSTDSPCVAAGSAAYSSGVDIDGEPWGNPPSIGCDEFHTGSVAGPLAISTAANYTNAAVGFVLRFTAQIQGHATVNFWDFDDGTFTLNQPLGLSHSFTNPGDYNVTLWAFNDTYPMGINATVTIHVLLNPTQYVAANSLNPAPPFLSWETAATNIQDAVDAAGFAGGQILVTNGIYATGGRSVYGMWTNRVVATKPMTLRSVNGPQSTVIDGGGAVRCVYLGGANLSGFTLTNGVGDAGGGILCEGLGIVSNCIITGNSARAGGGACYGTLNNCTLSGNSAYQGGGAFSSALNDCTLTGNSAENGGRAYGGALNGGGAFGGALNNCTIVGNSAENGGGVEGGTVNNCIVYFNTSTHGANYDYPTDGPALKLNYCCTTPYPGGIGNVTNAPMFVNQAGGNLRLQSNSPCINAGNNAYAPTGPDLDGNPRIANGTIDIGAYEFQTPTSVISYAWLQNYGLPTDGSADYLDSDGDDLNNWQEWRAGTNPTNALSVLRLLPLTVTGTNVTVSWQSVPGVNYFLEYGTNLDASLAFSLLQSNLVGQVSTTTYTDTNAVGPGPGFYRVGVGN